MKHLLIIIFVTLNYFSLKAQDSSRTEKITVGIEQDILPYILKGYIITAWVGRDLARQRFSYAQAETPSFTHGTGISSDRVNAFGFSFEYFFKKNFKGLWLGPGFGYWTNYITAEDGTKGKNESVIFSLGGGYNYYLTKWIYISPWLAFHTRVSGNDKINIGSSVYKPAIVTPEMSVKVGIKIF